mmetsp:Transcript_24038/g.77571  ORF Transcript_24038/g.77571 Transcript_24038/m.77571 type:complete len:264 (-) Transcript_24038:618-1409(-)
MGRSRARRWRCAWCDGVFCLRRPLRASLLGALNAARPSLPPPRPPPLASPATGRCLTRGVRQWTCWASSSGCSATGGASCRWMGSMNGPRTNSERRPSSHGTCTRGQGVSREAPGWRLAHCSGWLVCTTPPHAASHCSRRTLRRGSAGCTIGCRCCWTRKALCTGSVAMMRRHWLPCAGAPATAPWTSLGIRSPSRCPRLGTPALTAPFRSSWSRSSRRASRPFSSLVRRPSRAVGRKAAPVRGDRGAAVAAKGGLAALMRLE